MEIQNETVYDSDDLRALMDYAQVIGFKLREAAATKMWGEIYKLDTCPQIEPTMPPDLVRVAYRSRKPAERNVVKNGLSKNYVRITGKVCEGNIKFLIVRPTQLPLTAMEVIALAAADKDQRKLGRVVKIELLAQVLHVLQYVPRAWDAVIAVVDTAPDIHYGHKVSR